jgi:hypothetical protein
LRENNFDAFLKTRAEKIIPKIEMVMGKAVVKFEIIDSIDEENDETS